MPRLSSTIHALAASDDGALACATLRDSPLGARSTRVDAIPDALSMPAEQLAQALPSIGRSDGLIFVVPSSMVSLRPFAITASRWSGAEEDVMQEIEALLPLQREDARVGVLDLAPDNGRGPSERASLLGVSGQSARPWLEHLRAAIGRTPEALLSPAQCLPALGLQREERARVLEHAGAGEHVEHRLASGLPVALAQTPTPSAVPAYRLPGVPAEASSDARAISLAELALAGALTPRLGAKHVVPLEGRLPPTRSRWLIPAACLGLAGALAILATQATPVRTERALATIEARHASIEPDVERVAQLRREALALHALLENAVQPTLATYRPAMPDLEAARAALPDDAWLFRLELTETSLEMRGVARSPREVLRAIESSEHFTGARFGALPGAVPDGEGEIFHVIAERRLARETSR